MTQKERLLHEIQQVPDDFVSEIVDFVHFLKMKAVQERMEVAYVSESSLKKDWLNPKEDEAWQNL